MAWKKGESGNARGAGLDRPITDALRRAVAQDDGARLRRMVEAILDRAAEADPWSCNFVADRLEGKPRETVALDVEAVVRNIVSDKPMGPEDWAALHQVTQIDSAD